MIPSWATGGVLSAPPTPLITTGYIAGNSFAAQNFNWLLNHITLELNNVLTAAGVAQNSAVDNQLATALGVAPTPIVDLGFRLPLGVPTPIAEHMLACTGTGRHAQRTTTSTSAGHLMDSGATFVADGVQVGDYAYNFTDGTTAKITVVNSATDCSVDNDVFPTAKNYRIFPNITLPVNVKRCDGSTIADGASPFNGLKLPNLNSAGPYADNTVSGGRFLRGGSTSGVEMEDQGQGHYHSQAYSIIDTSSGVWNWGAGGGGGSAGNASEILAPKTDGTNGTPRTGKETRGRSISMVYVMRIK
jgi:hypothetical protein